MSLLSCCASMVTPAMDDVGARGGALKVVDPADEGDDGVGMVRHAKVRPGRVVELLHLTTVIALKKDNTHSRAMNT